MADKTPVLSIESLTVDFDLGKTCHAVRDTSVRIEPGEMVALVGESGCGKTMTLWRPSVSSLETPRSPRVRSSLTAPSCGAWKRNSGISTVAGTSP